MAGICGIKPWIGIHRNDTAAYLNDMMMMNFIHVSMYLADANWGHNIKIR